MEILNLDELAPIKRVVKLDGTDHQVKELSVEDWLASSAEAKRLEEQTEQEAVENIKSNIEHLQRVLPTIAAGRIAKLSFPQLIALIKFVNSEVEKQGQPAVEGADPK